MIGLSGLITPSLDEMVHVAKEMKRQGFTVPLLIGGATTSAMHTAVKIDPQYPGPVVYVKDASRAVGVAQNLIGVIPSGLRRQNQGRIRPEARTARQPAQPGTLLPLAQARANRPVLDWSAYVPPKPAFLGIRTFDDYPLAELAERIDWTPFFQAWELRGRYPAIFDDPEQGEHARQLVRRRPGDAGARSSPNAG